MNDPLYKKDSCGIENAGILKRLRLKIPGEDDMRVANGRLFYS